MPTNDQIAKAAVSAWEREAAPNQTRALEAFARVLLAELRPEKPEAAPVRNVKEVTWIVSQPDGDDPGGEFGVLVDGKPYFYYKWPTTEPSVDVVYRVIAKREFGEVIRRDVCRAAYEGKTEAAPAWHSPAVERLIEILREEFRLADECWGDDTGKIRWKEFRRDAFNRIRQYFAAVDAEAGK